MEGDAPTPRPGLTCPFAKLRPSQLVRDDAFYMSLAFNLAVDAWRIDEVPIGASIERGGEIIAAAHNEVERAGDPTAHAEMLAITQAARKIGDWRLNDCTLYVTKEPCPMCAGAIVHARLRRVIFGCPDAKGGGAGGLLNILQMPQLNHRSEITPGVMAEECLHLIQEFFRARRQTSLPPTCEH